MTIEYRTQKLKKECTDFKVAQKRYNKEVAEKLHFTINYIENAKNLNDIKNFPIFQLHPLQRDRKGTYSIDLGRRIGFRLIIKPLDGNNEEWKDVDMQTIYKSTTILVLLEVTNHYE